MPSAAMVTLAAAENAFGGPEETTIITAWRALVAQRCISLEDDLALLNTDNRLTCVHLARWVHRTWLGKQGCVYIAQA